MHVLQKHIPSAIMLSHCCSASCCLTAPKASTDPARLQTGTLLSKLAECIGDTDKAVRAALKELLSNVILPQLKGDMLGPFVPLVMAHLFSALTSLSEPVRSAPFCDTFCGATGRNHHPQTPCAFVLGVCSLCLLTAFDKHALQELT